MVSKHKQTAEKNISRIQSIVMSLPFLFTIGAVIFSISFILSSFPIGRKHIETDDLQRVYFADNIGFGHREIIRQFNKIHAGKIEVIPIDLPFTKFNTNQRKELIARNLRSRSSRIDVFSVDLVWVPRFTKWSEALSPYFSPQFLDNLTPQSLETCTVDGQLYAIPLYIDIGALFYREDLILALPGGDQFNQKIQQSISWSELLQLGDKYFPHQPLYLFQAEAYEGLICNFNEILGRPLQDSTSLKLINLTDSIVVSRVRFMRDLIQDGRSPREVLHMTEDDCIFYALDHDVPFVRGWPTLNNDLDERYEPEKFERLALAPLPHFEGETATPVFGGWNMMLSKHSPVKEAAIIFMKYAASYEGQKIFYEAEGLLPIQRQFFSGESTDPRQKRLRLIGNMMRDGIHRPSLANYTKISDVLSYHLHQILAGEFPVLEGLELAWSEIQNIQTTEIAE